MNKVEQCIQSLETGHLTRAKEIYETIKNSGTEEEQFLLAEALRGLGFLDQAASLYNNLLKHNVDDGELLTTLADIYIQLDREDEALNILNKDKKNDPFYIQSLLLQADLYVSQGLFEVSEQKLFEAEKIDPNEPVVQLALAEFYASIGGFAEAIYKFEQILPQVSELNDINIFQRLAEIYSTAGEFEKAIHYYERVLEDRLDIDCLFGYGLTAYQAGMFERAIEKLKETIQLDPEYQSAYLPLARSYEHIEDLENAIKIAKKGIEINPFQKELYQFAGKVCLKRGEEKEAEQYFKEAIKLDPSYLDAVLTLNKLYLKQMRYADIIELVEPMILEGEEDPYLLWDYALSCDKEERFSDALNAYQKAYSYLKENEEFLSNYGFFLLEEGNHIAAIEVFKQLRKMDPTNVEYIELLERLEETSLE